MADTNVTGGTRRELTKYRVTFAAAVIGLAGAGWIFQTAYEQHIKVLQIGDDTGQRLQMGVDPTVVPPAAISIRVDRDECSCRGRTAHTKARYG